MRQYFVPGETWFGTRSRKCNLRFFGSLYVCNWCHCVGPVIVNWLLSYWYACCHGALTHDCVTMQIPSVLKDTGDEYMASFLWACACSGACQRNTVIWTRSKITRSFHQNAVLLFRDIFREWCVCFLRIWYWMGVWSDMTCFPVWPTDVFQILNKQYRSCFWSTFLFSNKIIPRPLPCTRSVRGIWRYSGV